MPIILTLLVALFEIGCRATSPTISAGSDVKTTEAVAPAIQFADADYYEARVELLTAAYAKNFCSCLFVQRFEQSYCVESVSINDQYVHLNSKVNYETGRIMVDGQVAGLDFRQQLVKPLKAQYEAVFDRSKPQLGCSLMRSVAS